MSFDGFRPQALDFLIENRIQNSRTWFEEHRPVYNEQVLTPMRELVVALTPAMLEIDPQFTVAPQINKTIARIYRDTRFSRDKSLFRDELWITFMRNKRFWEGLPGYYFAFGPDGLFIGVGYYEASAESMSCFREMALRNEKSFRTMRGAYEKLLDFTLTGDRYKRSRYPAQPPELRFWLDLKNINFERKSTDFDLLFSPRLADALTADFRRLQPMYDFICEIEARRRR